MRWLTGKVAEVAGVAGVRLLRVNYVGELGWELHCPMREMPRVFDALMAAGKPCGIRLFGTYAMNSLRMEKAYRAWGGELTNEITMVEADMERFIDWDKDFIGKAATLASKREGPRTRLVYFEVEAGDADCAGNEPVSQGGKVVGLTTAGAYGFAVRKSLAFAYLAPAADLGAPFEIDILGEARAARVIPQPAYDPANARLKG
jgi:dimethylglycine dehydrogenase